MKNIKKTTALISIFSLVIFITASAQVTPAFKVLQKYAKVRDLTMNVAEDEAYVTVQSFLDEQSVIVRLKKENNKWIEAGIASFSGSYHDLEAFLSPNGLQLYFVSNRPLDNSSEKTKDYDIWMVDRKDQKASWSTPVNLGAPINTSYDEFYPVVVASGNLYFTLDAPSAKGKDDIFFSEFKNKTYTAPVSLDTGINSESYEFNAFVAPDESYLLFSGYNRKDGLGSGDMYISFKGENGDWKTAKNVGSTINSKFMDYCPFVVNNTLYFTSRRSTLKKGGKIDNLKTLETVFNSYENGLSRVYKVKFDLETLRK